MNVVTEFCGSLQRDLEICPVQDLHTCGPWGKFTGSPKLKDFILKATWMLSPDFMPIHQLDCEIFCYIIYFQLVPSVRSGLNLCSGFCLLGPDTCLCGPDYISLPAIICTSTHPGAPTTLFPSQPLLCPCPTSLTPLKVSLTSQPWSLGHYPLIFSKTFLLKHCLCVCFWVLCTGAIRA